MCTNVQNKAAIKTIQCTLVNKEFALSQCWCIDVYIVSYSKQLLSLVGKIQSTLGNSTPNPPNVVEVVNYFTR